MRKSIASFVLFAMTIANLSAAPNPIRSQLRESYIEQFSSIAVMESIRTGIPASIKLAQAILESGNGQSSLALRSNNHFGIKWRSPLDGDFVEFYDDDRDKQGKLKLSKFIKYYSPEESFRRHSEFLLTNSNYRLLFTYDRSDYRSWANGLKKAGYATNPRYAELLIKIIEDNHLDRFDIPTQLSLDETPQYPNQVENQLSEITPEVSQEAIRTPYPTPKVKVRKDYYVEAKPTQRIVLKNQIEEAQEEEHILFEITNELASKSVNTIKNTVPKRQKK